MPKSVAYNMDCLEAMREMPDNAFDLCVADPPYGINITGRHRSQTVHVERERERKQNAARRRSRTAFWWQERTFTGKAEKPLRINFLSCVR